ncbi:hypothetical protein BJV78DRAFT_1133717, partial [Lactifluus subvellereus]
RRAHKLFDNCPRSQRRSPDLEASNGICAPIRPVDGHVVLTNPPTPCTELHIPPQNVIDSAHYGYVYCMALLPSTREGATQSMREDVWKCFPNGLELLSTIGCTHGAILSLVTREDIIYAGCQDGYVRVWDLQTNTFIRTIIVQEVCGRLSLRLGYCVHLRI